MKSITFYQVYTSTGKTVVRSLAFALMTTAKKSIKKIVKQEIDGTTGKSSYSTIYEASAI